MKKRMKINYFAFGSNLSSPRLLRRIPAASAHCVATLRQHRLCWHKNGRDRSGKCDIVFSGDIEDIVYGVVYRMTHDERLVLDSYESADFGYARKEVEVTALHGEAIEVFTYYALDINERQQPYRWYKEHVLRGAIEHALPPHYIQHIRNTPSIEDQDNERHHRELSIYRDD